MALNRTAIVGSRADELEIDLQYTFMMDDLGEVLSEILCTTGVILNGTLITLILTHTPKPMRSYAVLLFNFALFDLLTCIASFFACQKTIFSDLALTYIFHGPCRYISPFFCYFCHCFVCHAMAHSQWILITSFYYRYRILVKEQPTVKQVVALTLIFYSFSFFILILYSFDVGDSNELKQIMYRLHPEYHYEDESIWGGNTTILSFATSFTILYMTFPCVPIYAAIHHYRHQTLKILGGNALEMSEATRKSHKKMIKALTIQAMIPIFWLIASAIFTSVEFKLIPSGPFLENITFRLMDCFPTCSPLVSLYFIAPYRKGLLGYWSKLTCRKQNAVVDAVVSVSGATNQNDKAKEIADLA
ncbi:unnamed protein product [Caenorhabditis auriculariae]|uniref:G-protein coupled receptors family 1 profile domain-containing protein n=1 Tax=Caenorhabditis auriculariae TaxID=2777116 RepID=A0A8S1H9J8_9PELO|nr:unnamed protein product [Caenorhabditis auriculariae]